MEPCRGGSMMMRRITLFVAALAAYTLLGMAFVSAAKLNDKAAKLTDENADWAGPMETTHYKCPGDVFDDVSYGHGHFMSDADRYVIVIDSIRRRRENDRRKGGATARHPCRHGNRNRDVQW